MEPENATPERLRESLRNAAALIEYASEEGVELPGAELGTVVSAQSRTEWGQEEETAFWQAYQVIAAALKPADPATVLQVIAERRGKASGFLRLFGHSRQEAHRQSTILLFTVVTFGLMLATTFLHGNMHTVNVMLQEQHQLKTEIQARMDRIADIKKTGCQDCQVELEQLQARIDEAAGRRQDNGYFLASWMDLFSAVTIAGEVREAASAKKYTYGQLRLIDKATAFMSINVFQYILPAMYGALGTFVFVLRELFGKRMLLYNSRLAFRYLVRVALGATAGVVAGVFFVNSDLSTMQVDAGVGTLGLSFLIGYNIDLFFDLMDKAIESIGGQKSRDEAPEASAAKDGKGTAKAEA